MILVNIHDEMNINEMGLVWFCDMSNIVGYLMPDLALTYILNM